MMSLQVGYSSMIHRLGSKHAKAGLGYLLDSWCWALKWGEFTSLRETQALNLVGLEPPIGF